MTFYKISYNQSEENRETPLQKTKEEVLTVCLKMVAKPAEKVSCSNVSEVKKAAMGINYVWLILFLNVR